jgi:DNA-binding IclR family transcriptional regulator
MTENDGVAAVNRALTILNSFTPHDASVSLATLATRTGYYKSTIIRLLSSLERFGYITRLTDGTYKIGVQGACLGAIYARQFNLHDHVPAVLSQVAEALNESASFYVLDADSRICLFRAEASRAIRDSIGVGDRLPLNVGAGGHVLMAFRPGSIRSAKAKKVREDFHSASFGERDPETAAVAVPVFNEGGLAGTLSISGPRYRLEGVDIQRIVAMLWRHAAKLTAVFGGDPSVYPVSTQPAKSAPDTRAPKQPAANHLTK